MCRLYNRAESIATSFQAVDAGAGVEVEFQDGRKVKVAELLPWNRLQDSAILPVDTGALPPFERGDLAKVSIGDRLVVFNAESGAFNIG